MKKILFIFVAIMPVLVYGMGNRQEMRKELEEFSARLSASLRFIDGVPYGIDQQELILPEERFLRFDDFRSRAAAARARNILVGTVARALNEAGEAKEGVGPGMTTSLGRNVPPYYGPPAKKICGWVVPEFIDEREEEYKRRAFDRMLADLEYLIEKRKQQEQE